MTTKLVFFGGGNMAEAIFAGLIGNPAFEIEVIQRNPEKVALLERKYPSIKVSQSLDYILSAQDILVLAIKPQQAKEACSAIKDKIQNCLLVSVMAGLSCQTISNWLDNARVIRTMPSTPSSVKQGITAIYSAPAVSSTEQKLINDIFAGIGMVYTANEENMINKIVPISSSAVAFLYYFMEGIIDNAVSSFGFSQEEANALVRQLLSGSNALLAANPEIAISEQRQRVTSKKGATEQGIITFEKNALHDITQQAMLNCYNRTLEMAKEFE